MKPSPFMEAAFVEAEAAARRGEVPIGAVVVAGGEILARAGNRTRALNDPTAHAEVLAIREACRLTGSERLPAADLSVTLAPWPRGAAPRGPDRPGGARGRRNPPPRPHPQPRAQRPARPCRGAGHPRGVPAAGERAAARRRPLRHARAMPDVRGGDLVRAHPAALFR